MIKNIIKSKIFSGAIGTGKTTNMINELQGVIRDNPNILIYVYEELPEIHNAFQNEHITDILTENVDLIVIGSTTAQNIPLELIKPYLYTTPIWLELETKIQIDNKHSY